MPRVSGVEFVSHIRAQTRALYTYVILLTSRSDKSDVVQGIEAGADDFVSKPFDREELRVRLLAGERVVRLERALTLEPRSPVNRAEAQFLLARALRAAGREPVRARSLASRAKAVLDAEASCPLEHALRPEVDVWLRQNGAS
jgi:DNA-binding response OmpR family regulator